MKKILYILLLFCFLCISADAKLLKKSYLSIINDSNIPQASVAISIKNVDTGKKEYSINDKILMHPASLQKMLTIVPIANVLGDDYEFSTEIYSRGSDKYIIKLGADPYLTHSELRTLVNKIESGTVKKIYIDDSIIEDKDWGEGWQWDDDLNIYMPKFNSYNLDGNLLSFTILPTQKGKQAGIINISKYPIGFLNNVITGDSNNITISRNNAVAANIIKLDGTVNTAEKIQIPNNNLKRYFEIKLTQELENNKIYLKETYSGSKILPTDKKLEDISHPINIAIIDILQNSNNMAIETLAKLAGGKYYNKQGTDTDSVKLFNDYCEKNGLDISRIKIVDASGVSKNNLTDADFVTEFLIKHKDNKTLGYLTQPGFGTLSDRMIPLKNNLKAKTGTLSDISSIAGYLTAKSGKKYAFCIMINDPSSNSLSKKNLEDYLIREMYTNL